jgi:hypothetical protein
MKEVSKMRLGVLRELKQIIKFFKDMENGVKSRDNSKIYPAYIYLTNLAYHMNEGDLTPLSIELKQALLHREYLIKNGELIE